MKKIKTVAAPAAVVAPVTTVLVKTKRITLSSRFKDLILEGKTDAEVYAQIKTEFPTFGQKKTHNRYAAWYRSQIKAEAKSAE